ncbi:HD domain-containing protein [Micromonospora sp. NPDC047644]|uniref:HD domain-containing protein n=1 Tax=Micromonospora sp. NPDC047644 TaxID=3157203 RepID=UPI003455FCCE
MGMFDSLVHTVPGGPAALALLNDACEPAIVHHSIRVLRYALALREQDNLDVEDEVLVHSCLLHDIGASRLASGPERFEVQGADLAVNLLIGQGWRTDRLEAVWTAIAVHTSPHIAERISAPARLVRLAVRADFSDDLITPELRRATEDDLPRLDVERVLSGVVVAQAEIDQRRAPGGSWPGDLLAAHRCGSGPDARLAGF